MAALRVQDFDILRRRVNVSRSVTESGGLQWSTPKTHERQSVPFPAVLANKLAALMVGKDRDAPVFTDQRGGVLRNSNWRARVFQPAVEKCQKADDTFPSITPPRLEAYGGKPGHQRRGERQGRPADARPRQSEHDPRRVCRSVRRGLGQGCGPVGHRNSVRCGPAADWDVSGGAVSYG
jgi:hypothetical protein